MSEARLGGHAETYGDHPEFLLHEHEKQPKVRRHFYFKRTHGAALAAIFVASLIVIFYLATQRRANGLNPTSGQAETSLRPQNVAAIDTDGVIANQSAAPTAAKPDVHYSASIPNMAVRLATKESPPATKQAGIQANTSPMTHTPGSANLGRKWSVQVSAAPAEDIADTLVQRLKSQGVTVAMWCRPK